MFALRFFFDIVRAQTGSARLKKSPPPNRRGLFALRDRFYRVAMMDTARRTRQQERELLELRTPAPQQPPTREEIRRQMGWDLIPPGCCPDHADMDR
jgi:hypothetical protein